MRFCKNNAVFFSVFLIPIIISGIFFIFLKEVFLNLVFKYELISSVTLVANQNNNNRLESADKLPKALQNPPRLVKALYLTSWSAGTEGYVNYAINLAKSTEINALVIDIKDSTGNIAYDAEIPQAKNNSSKTKKIADIDSLINRLHQEGIYAIARIVVFQDPILAKNRSDLAISRKSKISSQNSSSPQSSLWSDNSGLAWVDPASTDVWDYIVALSKDALKHGFDELNYDYVRFPSDGDLKDMSFPLWNETIPRAIIIRKFFEYLRQNLPEAKLSVDIFGVAAVKSDDLGIGQIIEDAYNYFDYVCPMFYPSHYSHGFRGYKYPAAYPYDIVFYSAQNARNKLQFYQNEKEGDVKKTEKQRRVKLRPWLQDFDLQQDLDLNIVYSAEMVKLEIKALSDALIDDFSGFMLWNPTNIYTKEALQPADSE